jgi:hypothetical protein
MQDRRLVGIGLGITSTHTVRVLSGDGTIVCRRKAVPPSQPGRGGAGRPDRDDTRVLPGGGAGADWALLAADRGVLLCPRAHRVPGQLGQGP